MLVRKVQTPWIFPVWQYCEVYTTGPSGLDGEGGGGSPSYPSATGKVQYSALRITHGFIQKDAMQDISDTCLALSSSLINSDSFLENRLARS